MKKAIRKIMAMGLTAAIVAGTLGGTAIAEETAATPAANPDFAWLTAAPEGWTEADATETMNFHSSSAITWNDTWAAACGDGSQYMAYLWCDQLMFRKDDGTMVPWLAESIEYAEDGMSAHVVMRQGCYFTNGDEVTADDAIFSMERIVYDTENCPDNTAKQWRNYFDHAEKLGDYEFSVYLKTPNPLFTSNLNGLTVLPKKYFEEVGYEKFWAQPVGSGAYKVVNMDYANGSVSLELRDDEHGYWGYDYTGSYTNVKYANIQYAPEGTTRLSSLRTKEADVINDLSTLDASALEAEGFNVKVCPAVTEIFLQYACGEGDAFANRDLREAVSLAIDREAIVAALLNGYGIPAKTNAIEGDLGYQTEHTYEYNPEKAKELVEKSGYDGTPLRFIYTTSTVSIATELAQTIQSMCAQVGINLEVVPLEVAIYDESRGAHDFDLVLASIIKHTNMWYLTASEVIGNDRFCTGLQNTELMELGQKAAVTANEDAMNDVLTQMAVIEMTEFEPNCYLYFPTLLFGINPDVKDLCNHNQHYIDMRFAKKNI